MRKKKYRGVFLGCDSGEETTQEFEDWIGADGKLVVPIKEVVHDWAYQFYDKGSYKTISFEEIVVENASQEDWGSFWRSL